MILNYFTFVHKNNIIYVRKDENMKNNLEELSKKYDVFSTKLLLENGFTKYQIKKLVVNNELVKLKHGLYTLVSNLDDEFYYNQMNNQYFIYSNETALYFHKLSDRYPRPLTVTTKSGYHLRNKNLKVYYVNEELLKLGVMEMNSPQGYPVKVYDQERTICDIIKNKKRIDPQVYSTGLQSYFLNGNPQLRKLSRYAKKLKIQDKVMSIVELYMKS